MSDYAHSFIRHLEQLEQHDRGALAALRRSLGFEPGAYVPAYPYVERFVKPEWSARAPHRRALYIVAGLYALNPRQGDVRLGAALGRLQRQVERESIEKRFIALLGADPENIHTYLRQVVTLLAANDFAFDYTALFWDVAKWVNLFLDPEERDAIRQNWARDFYRQLSGTEEKELPPGEPEGTLPATDTTTA